MVRIQRELRLRLAIGFVERFVGSMITPLMIIYLAEQVGPAEAGALLVGVVAVGVAASLAAGHLADRSGRRVVLVAGGAGMGAALLGMAAAHACGRPLAVYACYLLQVAAMTSIQPAHEAMIIDVTTPETRRPVYSFNYWSNNLALSAGALVGGFFYRHHLTALLLCYAAAILATAAVSCRFLVESRPPEPEAAGGPPRGLRQVVAERYRGVLGDRRFLLLLLVMVAIMGLEFQKTGYIGAKVSATIPAHSLSVPLLGHSLGGVELVGALRAESTFLVVALALTAQPLLRRFSNGRSVYTGTVLFTAGYVLLAVVSGSGGSPGARAGLLVAATAVATCGEIMHAPAVQSVMAEIVPAHARSRYMAVFGLNPKGGQLIGAGCLSLGAVLSSTGMGVLYAALGATALLASWKVLNWRPRPAVPDPEIREEVRQ